MSDSNFICNAVWNSIAIYPNGELAPCCMYDRSKDHTKREFRGVSTFEDLQQQMLDGKCPPGCAGCLDSEQRGLDSYRMKFGSIPKYRNSTLYVDIRNNNTCNLTCRMCNSEFSSSWSKVTGELEFNKFNVWPILEELSSNNLTEIYFTGGEPMLNPDHWALLEQLIANNKSRQIELRYNTNLSTLSYKGKHVTELWKFFKKITVYASLEASGEPGQYIRSGLQWDNVEKSIDSLREFRTQHINVHIHVFCTLGLLNVWFMPELIQWCKEKQILLEISMLEGPDFLSLAALPKSLEHLIPDIQFERNRQYQNNTRILNLAKSKIGESSDLFLHTIAHILLLDKIKGDKMFDSLPIEVQNFAKQRVFSNKLY